MAISTIGSSTSPINHTSIQPALPTSSFSYTPGFGVGNLGIAGNVGNIAGGLVSSMGSPFNYQNFTPLPAFRSGLGVGMPFDPYTFLSRRARKTESTGRTPPLQDFSNQVRGTPLGRAIGLPFAAYSWLVGHDGAQRAAANGDLAGWYVNRLDHATHGHILGGNEANPAPSPLSFLGAIGQEIGYRLGIDQLYGKATDYDKRYGTNYAVGHNHGKPRHLGG